MNIREKSIPNSKSGCHKTTGTETGADMGRDSKS